MKKLFLFLSLFLLIGPLAWADDIIRIGSKKFTEGYLLSEILAQLIESETTLKVERKFGLGGTIVIFEALKNGEIDLYPEYSGTLVEQVLGGKNRGNLVGLKKSLRKNYRLDFLSPFGFNNTYALAVRRSVGEKRGILNVSDLRRHPDLTFGLGLEFLKRKDGWLAVSRVYSLEPNKVVGLDHGLAYESVASGKVDVIDSYSTDAKISKFDLLLLIDDQNFFPSYLAAPLVRGEILEKNKGLKKVLNQFAGKISNERMQRLNSEVELEGKSFAAVASGFLKSEGIASKAGSRSGRGLRVLLTEHLNLIFISVGLAVLIGVPLGLFISSRKRLSKIVLGVAGILQTIPSIALLVFMIPLFGIGATPAIVALFLYSLLPIIRNTSAGIQNISPIILEAADGVGLSRRQRLLHVEFPLALRLILAGIRTSAVIAIGTATLAAFIGAGGLGEPIVTGLALNNMKIVMSGAIPAAVLAIVIELFFEWIERRLTPRGLKKIN